MLQETAAVHTRRKTRWNPSAVDDAVERALLACRKVPQAVPVLHAGEVVGLVRGSWDGSWADYMPLTRRQWCGFQGYPDLDQQAKNGKYTRITWNKTTSSLTVGGLAWTDFWPCGGSPGAGDYSGTANTARQFDNTTVGGIQHRYLQPAATETRHVAQWEVAVVGATTPTNRQLFLYDRVLSYDGASITTTTTTLTNTLAAQRYISAGQDGLLISVMVSAVTGATASNINTVTFTDQNGNTAVTWNPGYTVNWEVGIPSPSATQPAIGAAIHDSPFLPMGPGVTGLRKIETFVSSAINTGTVCFALVKPLATMWGSNSVVTRQDLARGMFTLERVFDGACLNFLATQASNNAADVQGKLWLVHG
jgi:hypothetical protein